MVPGCQGAACGPPGVAQCRRLHHLRAGPRARGGGQDGAGGGRHGADGATHRGAPREGWAALGARWSQRYQQGEEQLGAKQDERTC